MTELLGQRQRGEYVSPSADTLGPYVRAWLAGRKASIRPSTHHGYHKIIEAHIIPRLGQVPLQQLTRERVGVFYAELQRERGLGARSILHVHRLLKHALRDAVDDHKIAHNPADRVELPKLDADEMHAWTPADVRRFLDHVAGDRLYALWHAALATGARRGEVCGLTWANVGLDAGTVKIAQTRLSVGSDVIEGEPKTKRGARTIAVDAVTVGTL